MSLFVQFGFVRSRLFGRPDANNGVDEEAGIKSETRSHGCEQAADAKAKPIDCCHSGAGAHDQTGCICAHGGEAPAQPLAHKEEPEAETETEIKRADDMKVQCADTRHFRAVTEQPQPKHWLDSDKETERSAHGRNRAGSNPGDLTRAFVLSRAPVCTHHCDNGRSEAE